MFRAIFAATIVAACGAQALAAGPIAAEIPVPGGTVALARAIGLETPPDPALFLAELARLSYGVPEGRNAEASSTLQRLLDHLDVASRFRTALAALPDGTVSLTLAAKDKDSREHLKDLLTLIDLRLKESRGIYAVEESADRDAASRVRMLVALGVDLEPVASRLNAGDSIRLNLPTELVPVPLTASVWSDVIFHHPVTAPDLVAAIFADSRTAFLCRGLAGLDDETLQYVADHPALLERLAGNDAPVFAAFASALRVRGGRMLPPGGAAAAPLWEAVVGEPIDQPEAFIHGLLAANSGHLAYLYDLLGELDEPRRNFALGAWIQDDRSRRDHFRSLVATVHSTLAEWDVRVIPFARPLDDIAWLLLNVTAGPDGTPHGPAARRLWSRIFESAEVPEAGAAVKQVEQVDRDGVIDAAWLAETILAGDSRQRGARLQQLAYGLRVFGTAPPGAFGEVLTAVRALPDYPSLLLTLERMQITDPALHAAAARAAQRLAGLEGEAAFVALNQFQGAVALLSRMAAAGTLDGPRASGLVASLSGLAIRDGGYGTAVTQWVRSELLPVLTPRRDAEETILAAVAGATAISRGGAGRVSWEGEQYRLDLPAAEEKRLRAVREQQHAATLDTALSLDQIARSLAAPTVDLEEIQRTVAVLKELQPVFPPAVAADRAVRAEGVETIPDGSVIVDRALKDLGKITRPKDARKAAALAGPLRELSGVVLGEALSSIAYTLNLGDPSDGAMLGVDLYRRHDFGLGLKDGVARHRAAWAVPQQTVVAGRPRRVSGSLLGLDVAFARTALRRVVLDQTESAPVLLSNDRETFTRSVAFLNPYTMRDADRDGIAAAIERGRARVAALVAPAPRVESLDALASELNLDGWRHRAAQWDSAHDPARVASLFSLTEFFVLGAKDHAAVDAAAWGMAGTPVSGCLCSQLGAPNLWQVVAGRPQIGALGSAIPDVNLHVATLLAALRLPAPLAKLVVGAAMQEFMNRVRPNDPNDWLTLVRGAALVSRERIEDYVAAATADGPLVPERSYQEQP